MGVLDSVFGNYLTDFLKSHGLTGATAVVIFAVIVTLGVLLRRRFAAKKPIPSSVNATATANPVVNVFTGQVANPQAVSSHDRPNNGQPITEANQRRGPQPRIIAPHVETEQYRLHELFVPTGQLEKDQDSWMRAAVARFSNEPTDRSSRDAEAHGVYAHVHFEPVGPGRIVRIAEGHWLHAQWPSVGFSIGQERRLILAIQSAGDNGDVYAMGWKVSFAKTAPTFTGETIWPEL